MKKRKNENSKNILIIILDVIIIILVVSVAILAFKWKYDEERLDDLEDKYEYIYDNEDMPNQNQNEKTITKDNALNIVLAELKIDKNKIRDLDIELEYKPRYQKRVYEVSFDYNHLEYEYYIDATKGEIVDSFKSLD